MFDALTDKLTAIFQRLGSRGRLTEQDVDSALREVRMAILEADVNFRVARDLIAKVKECALGEQVLQSLSPGQQVVKIVYEELTAVLGGSSEGVGATHASPLRPSPRAPSVCLMVGLQGSGKTTTAAKLALQLRKQGHRSLLVAADLRRPAAIQQLQSLGKQLDIPVYAEAPEGNSAVTVARNGVEYARTLGVTWVIVDTGGRLHIDDELMAELEQVKAATEPAETILVVDAMTGQDAVRAAQDFHARMSLTGLVLSKLDGDARGGAALSIASVTGVPVKFIGMGERAEALEPFYPDRMASRILGMGDVKSLVELAQQETDAKQAKVLEKKLRTATFNLEDMLQQLQQVKKMGPISQIMGMLPGFSALSKRMPKSNGDEDRQLRRTEAIILAMTPQERRNPDLLNGSRRRRVALGSGVTPSDVNQLLGQFRQTQKLMKQLSTPQGRKTLTRMMR